MRKGRGAFSGHLPGPPRATTTVLPPPGLTYMREQDERPYRVKALHEQHPFATCQELARLYESEHGAPLTKNMAAAALRQADVRLFEQLHQEVLERPRRLAKLLATMPQPTRDKLAAAYQRLYGISLPYDLVSKALRQMGIRLVEPMRKPDRDEVEARGLRLYELAEEHPELTYDELGIKYEDAFGVRLPPSTVGRALNLLEVYRSRLVDLGELAKRPGRLRRLAESNPEFETTALAKEYERLYDTKLHVGTVQLALNRLGIYRMPSVDLAERAKRPERLQALAKKYPYMNCTQLAQEYERRYKVIVSRSTVENTLHSLGGYRHRPVDAKELKERHARIKKLREEHPTLNATQLAEAYREQHGVTLLPTAVVCELNKLGVFRHRQTDREEFKKRSARLRKLHQAHPMLTCEQLAKEYEKAYRCSLPPLLVSRALNRVGIFRQNLPTAVNLRQRVERLQAIATECPNLNKKDLIAEYRRLYGEVLNAHSTRAMLRRRGVYQSRGEITRQRVERLKAIAAECPDLSKAGIVKEYGRRFGEMLNIPSTLTTLRRLGVLAGR